VPASQAEVDRYLAAHSPHGMLHPPEEPGQSVIHDGPFGIQDTEYDPKRQENPAAFTSPSLLVESFQIGDHTVLKTTTFLSARQGVSAQHRILDEVTAVRIERIGREQGDRPNRKNHRLPTIKLSAASDPRDVERLVDAFNALYGSPSGGTTSCPFPGVPQPQTTITFMTKSVEGDAGTVAATWYPSCFGQITVTVNGRQLEGTLHPDSWTRLIYDIADAG
jgi:hypothetical protein